MLIPLVLPLQLLEHAIQSRFENPQDWMGNAENSSALADIELESLDGIRIYADEGKLQSSINLKVRASLKRDRRFIPNIPSLEKVEMKLSVRVSSALSLSKDWKLQAESQADYQWQEEPSWGGGILKLPLKSFVNPFLTKVLKEVAQNVDSFIQNEVDLEEVLWESWTLLQNSIEIETDWGRPLYLNLGLEEEYVEGSSIFFENGNGKMILKLDFDQNKIKAGGQKEEPVMPPMLPTYEERLLTARKDELLVDAHFSKEEMEFILDQMEFPLDLRTRIRLSNSALQVQKGEGNMLEVVLKTDLFGRSKPFKIQGQVLLTCLLGWGASAESFEVKDLSYQLLKGNAIFRFFGLIRRSALRNELASMLRMELNSQWQKARMAIWEGLTHFEINEYAALHTKELEVGLLEVSEHEKGALVSLKLSGKPELNIVKLHF